MLSITKNLSGVVCKRIISSSPWEFSIFRLILYNCLDYIQKEVINGRRHSGNHLERPFANFRRFYLSLESS